MESTFFYPADSFWAFYGIGAIVATMLLPLFIIDFLIDHEKSMDRILARLEKALEVQSKKEQIQVHPQEKKILREDNQNPFVLTITSPSGFKQVKSVRLDWEDENQLTNISDLGKKLAERLTQGRVNEGS